MPRASIDYMNDRRALMPASGGAKQSRRVEYAPADDWETTLETAKAHISDFAIWAEVTRQTLVARLAIPQADETEIPF